MHLDLDHAVALAGFAAPTFDVERESARAIAARLGVGEVGEPLADRCEGARVRRGVRARRASDRRLVDVDHLVEMLEALDSLMGARRFACAVEFARGRLENGVDQEGRLAAAGDASDAREHADRQ